MRNLVSFIGWILTASAVSAHPEHAGSDGVGLLHYVTDPFHIATGVLTIGVALLIIGAWRVHRRRAAFSHRPR